MPVDRRAYREDLFLRRLGRKPLLAFDFDCTITVRHMFKVFAWGFSRGDENAHAHCKAFFSYCEERDLPTAMEGGVFQGIDGGSSVLGAVEDFVAQAGEEAFKDAFREVFLGGEQRIAWLTARLEKLHQQGVQFCIVTAGMSSSVVRCLIAVPEWRSYFPSDRIWDTSQSRHSVRSVACHKVLMLRDICPSASKAILIDDSLCRDRPPRWMLEGAQVEIYEDLPYEGPGVSEATFDAIEAWLKL